MEHGLGEMRLGKCWGHIVETLNAMVRSGLHSTGCEAFEGLLVGKWPDQSCVLESYLETDRPIKKLL